MIKHQHLGTIHITVTSLIIFFPATDECLFHNLKIYPITHIQRTDQKFTCIPDNLF